MSRAILWFRNDLRLADNGTVHAACADHQEVLPVFIIDTRQHGPSPFGFERSGSARRRFLHESLHALDADLRAKGSALQVHAGRPEEVLAELGTKWEATTVHAQRSHAWEEVQQQHAMAQRMDLQLHEPSSLLHPDDLPFPLEKLPQVFTAFRAKVEKHWTVREAWPEPEVIRSPTNWSSMPLCPDTLPYTISTPETRAVFQFRGGRTAAMERLRHYASGPERLGRYKLTRNALLGADNSGKFSPWLASGALGPREVYRAVKQYEHRYGANESSYWMVFELLWRDFFQFTAAKHGRDLFQKGGIAHKAANGHTDQRRFQAWCDGRTGQPFIDANMRELAATGWMSNRGRQNVASYLVHDLGIDWRLGAYWFERLLIDYDPCSNWGNWQYVAGVGNDPREGRRFDPERQAGMYDADGAYVKKWT